MLRDFVDISWVNGAIVSRRMSNFFQSGKKSDFNFYVRNDNVFVRIFENVVDFSFTYKMCLKIFSKLKFAKINIKSLKIT